MELAFKLGNSELCADIEEDKISSIRCFGGNTDLQLDYCLTAKNRSMCYFALAIRNGNLTLCQKSDDVEQCEIIVQSKINLCTLPNKVLVSLGRKSDYCYQSSRPFYSTIVYDLDKEQCFKITLSDYSIENYTEICLFAVKNMK